MSSLLYTINNDFLSNILMKINKKGVILWR